MVTFNAHETERMTALHGVELASFSRRAGAFIIDIFILTVLFIIIGSIIEPLLRERHWMKNEDQITLALNLNWYSIVWTVLYFGITIFLGNGKTPGKKVCGIRIVSLASKKITLWQSIERALGYGYSLLEFFFGFIQFFLYLNRRTLHDRIAETIVVCTKSKKSAQ